MQKKVPLVVVTMRIEIQNAKKTHLEIFGIRFISYDLRLIDNELNRNILFL